MLERLRHGVSAIERHNIAVSENVKIHLEQSALVGQPTTTTEVNANGSN
jgi:hypothetical protein